jgi:predicted GNAT family acetyltransferase
VVTRHDVGMTSTPEISNQTGRHRYELAVDGKMAAHIDYELKGDGVVDLFHTEVDPAFEGQGLGSKIARFALDDARSHGRKVIPSCPYIAGYVGKHPEYADLISR